MAENGTQYSYGTFQRQTLRILRPSQLSSLLSCAKLRFNGGLKSTVLAVTCLSIHPSAQLLTSPSPSIHCSLRTSSLKF